MVRPEALCSDGLVICGLPIQDTDTPQAQDDLPLGTPDFIAVFLTSVKTACATKLTALQAIVDFLGPASIASLASHVCLRLLRYNIQYCWAHLWRFPAPHQSLPLAQALDTSFLTLFLNSCKRLCVHPRLGSSKLRPLRRRS